MNLFPFYACPEVDAQRIIVGDASRCSEVTGAALVHVDPPWSYSNKPSGAADSHYGLLTDSEIAVHIATLEASATPDAYLFVWCTWPKLAEWLTASRNIGGWGYKTGGSWHKTGGSGIGYHLRGDSEPWLLYTRGAPKPRAALSNAWSSPRREHSQKPTASLQALIAALTDPGDLVLDLYAGRAPCGVAARLEGRRYVGIEIDPERAEIGRMNILGARPS